jgi:hypothetical protein
MTLQLVFAGRKFRILEYRRLWPRQFRPAHGSIEKSSGHRPICLPSLARIAKGVPTDDVFDFLTAGLPPGVSMKTCAGM